MRFTNPFASTPSTETTLRLWHWTLGVLLSLTFAWALTIARFPAALLIGPVIVATAMGLRGTPVRVPKRLHETAQGVAGCLIAHYMTPEIARSMVELWPAVLAFVLLTLLVAGLVGLAIGRLTTVGREEAIWGFLPGMAGTMITMNHERGVDSRLVAFMQLLRLMVVILVMTLVSRALVGGALHSPGAQAPVEGALQAGALLTVAIALIGPLAARFLPFIPAAATLAPLMIAGVLQGTGWVDMALPNWLLVAAYLVLGAQVGLRFTPEIVRHAAGIFFPVLLGALGLMALCAVSGVALVTGVDFLTGMLATVPGSIETIAIIAINSNADVSFIMTLQFIRLFAVVLIGPPMARVLCHLALTGEPKEQRVQTPGE